MNVRPASVHFRAKAGFSLSCELVARSSRQALVAYKSIARMNALATFLFCNLYDSIAIEICRSIP